MFHFGTLTLNEPRTCRQKRLFELNLEELGAAPDKTGFAAERAVNRP
jgi:hypothetical protein